MLTITEGGMTKPIRRRSNLSRLFLICMVGIWCAGLSDVHEAKGKETSMGSGQTTIWGLVDAIGKMMPISKEAVETVLRTELIEQTRDEYLWHLVGVGQRFDDGLFVARVSLALMPGGGFGKNSGLSIELGGRCIGLDEIRSHFGELTIVQHPRGRSLQETTVYAAAMQWGELSFAFKEENRNCLFRVSFRNHMS